MLKRTILIILPLIVLALRGMILGLSLELKPCPKTPSIIQPSPEIKAKTKPKEIDTSNWKIYRNGELE